MLTNNRREPQEHVINESTHRRFFHHAYSQHCTVIYIYMNTGGQVPGAKNKAGPSGPHPFYVGNAQFSFKLLC